MSAIGIANSRPLRKRPSTATVHLFGLFVLVCITVVPAALWALIFRFPDTAGVAYLVLLLAIVVLGGTEMRMAARAE